MINMGYFSKALQLFPQSQTHGTQPAQAGGGVQRLGVFLGSAQGSWGPDLGCGVAAICEMLLQSHIPGYISLLPALPIGMSEQGSISNLKAKGNLFIFLFEKILIDL